MNKKIFFLHMGSFLILGSALASLDPQPGHAASFNGERTLVLYDAASGTIPAAPLMNFTDFPPGVASPTYLNGAAIMDTTIESNETYAGWTATGATVPGFPLLDRTSGFQVDFTIQLENESHTNTNRAGFSVIILSADSKGIELAFWPNEIWTQNDDHAGGLFTHGEGIVFPTTSEPTRYQVTVTGDIYTLEANGAPILNGPVRDYSAFDGFPDPYETSNFLFLGDDTTSAQARVMLSFVSVTGMEPTLATTGTAIINPSSPLPTVSSTSPVIVTPASSPTPTGKGFLPCPSGWIFFTMAFTIIVIVKKSGRVNDPP